MRRAALFALLMALAIGAPAGASAARADSKVLTIYAASSLTEAFRALDPAGRYSFASSGTLEQQIRQGAEPDLFAAASPEHTQRLFREGLVERPVAFASNRLALIVPKDNPARIRSVGDLAGSNADVVVAAPSVPVGRYTRTVLHRLGLSAILDRVVSQEPDAKAVVGKVALGQVDAGFAYVTDARPVADRVLTIAIPARVQPRVRYEIAVVSSSESKPRARAWIRSLLSAKGRSALRAAGFLPAPAR